MVEKEKDIVERLRNPPNSSWYEIMGQAADEIERLRAVADLVLQSEAQVPGGLVLFARAALGQQRGSKKSIPVEQAKNTNIIRGCWSDTDY